MVKYANSTFYQILNSSALKDRIVIGKHNLECSGDIIAASYRDDKNNKYDGVHMNNNFGLRAYKRSVTKLQAMYAGCPIIVNREPILSKIETVKIETNFRQNSDPYNISGCHC